MPPTIVGVPVAIHAAKRRPTRDERDDLYEAMQGAWGAADKAMRDRLNAAWAGPMAALVSGEELPFGAVVCIVRFAASVPAETIAGDPFGDFSAGRWATPITELIEVLQEPIAARGFQGPFHWERP